eukprot:RCo049486
MEAMDAVPVSSETVASGAGPATKRMRFDDPAGRFLGKPVDFYSSIVTFLKSRNYRSSLQRTSPAGEAAAMQPSGYHAKDILPCSAMADNPVASVCTTWVHSYNSYRRRTPVLCCLWTPEGRRLLTGNRGGEVAILNGFAFNSLH